MTPGIWLSSRERVTAGAATAFTAAEAFYQKEELRGAATDSQPRSRRKRRRSLPRVDYTVLSRA